MDGALFPRNAEVTPIPNYFFSHVLPEIEDPDELRVVLHIFFAIRCKTVFPRFVTHSELLAHEELTGHFLRMGTDAEEGIRLATARALERGLIVAVAVPAAASPGGAGDPRLSATKAGYSPITRPGPPATHPVGETLYFVNDEAGRRAAHRVQARELTVALPKVKPADVPDTESKALLDLYEANFGPLTPLIAESIAEARTRYPEEWLPRAMKKAVAANVRRWNYVEAILERWQNEGSEIDEETGRDPEAERLWQRYVRAKGWRQ